MKTSRLICIAQFCSFSLCASLLAPSLTFAGANTGGGGGSIVCFKSAATLAKVRAQNGKLSSEDLAVNSIESIEAYDLYQARNSSGLRSVLSKPLFELLPSEEYPSDFEGELTYAAYIERLAKRFELTVPAVSDFIREAAKGRSTAIVSFADGVAQVDDARPVMNVPDVNRCALITTALQYNEGNQLYITFDRRLMAHPKNSQLSRAVLNLHEDLYALARVRVGQIDSRPTRDLISEILPAQLGVTQRTLLARFNDLGLGGCCASGALACNGFSYSQNPEYGNVVLEQGTFSQRVGFQVISNLVGLATATIGKYDQNNMDILIQEGRAEYSNLKVQWFREFTHARSAYVTGKVASYWAKMGLALQSLPGATPALISAMDALVHSMEIMTIDVRVLEGNYQYDEVSLGSYPDGDDIEKHVGGDCAFDKAYGGDDNHGMYCSPNTTASFSQWYFAFKVSTGKIDGPATSE